MSSCPDRVSLYLNIVALTVLEVYQLVAPYYSTYEYAASIKVFAAKYLIEII